MINFQRATNLRRARAGKGYCFPKQKRSKNMIMMQPTTKSSEIHGSLYWMPRVLMMAAYRASCTAEASCGRRSRSSGSSSEDIRTSGCWLRSVLMKAELPGREGGRRLLRAESGLRLGETHLELGSEKTAPDSAVDQVRSPAPTGAA